MTEVLDASHKILDIKLPCEASEEEVLCDDCPFNIGHNEEDKDCSLYLIHERAKEIIKGLSA